MQKEKVFVDGLIIKDPRKEQKEWILANLYMKRDELIGWLQKQPEDFIALHMKRSQGGKLYLEVDTWKPDPNYKKGVSILPPNPPTPGKSDGLPF
jgi:hypothetical protein|tara:strand:- start:735 stop:1019 length:285 start_codon:yes stop_codon:yes gene_type:complete